MTFESLGLVEPILKALNNEGYEKPTPIQAQAIPVVLENRDLIGCAQTGTGKTAAFAIPIIQNLYNKKQNVQGKRDIKVLILTPTRELAIQIADSFSAYGKFAGLHNTVIFGGVGQHPQTVALRKGVDILIATPGRLLDLMDQGFVNLKTLEVFVLDEADRMLDMGFIHDVKKIISHLPVKRQTLFFSATMPPEIVKLSSSILTSPVKVEVTPQATTAQTVNQSLYYVEKGDKKDLLAHIMSDRSIERALVFTRTKHGANKVVKDLLTRGIKAEAIHGNKSQSARQLALKNFKDKTTRVLVATDIAARGIDVDDLTHVINYELPNVPETYVHRIGRTGRAGASGTAISFCESEERAYLKDIQKLISQQIPVLSNREYSSSIPADKMFDRPKDEFGNKGSRGGNNQRRGSDSPKRNDDRRHGSNNGERRNAAPAHQRNGEKRNEERSANVNSTSGSNNDSAGKGGTSYPKKRYKPRSNNNNRKPANGSGSSAPKPATNPSKTPTESSDAKKSWLDKWKLKRFVR
ncbi:MAG: DEAD/DEAH box helicase [Flavobacteriales bacterium]